MNFKLDKLKGQPYFKFFHQPNRHQPTHRSQDKGTYWNINQPAGRPIRLEMFHQILHGYMIFL